MIIPEAHAYIEHELAAEIPQRETRLQYAWWLLEAITDQSKINLLTCATPLNERQIRLMHHYINDIVHKHKPLAYVIGHVPFGPLSIIVEPPILIPRPETEEWVMRLIGNIKEPNKQKLIILDVCTGTGCIALLCAKMLPHSRVYGVDINSQAIALAEKNKRQLGIDNVTFLLSDLFNQLPRGLMYDLIISNPPYISATEYQYLAPSVSLWEDRQHCMLRMRRNCNNTTNYKASSTLFTC